MDTQIRVDYRLKVFRDGVHNWCFRIYNNGWMIKEAHRKTWHEAMRSGQFCLRSYYPQR